MPATVTVHVEGRLSMLDGRCKACLLHLINSVVAERNMHVAQAQGTGGVHIRDGRIHAQDTAHPGPREFLQLNLPRRRTNENRSPADLVRSKGARRCPKPAATPGQEDYCDDRGDAHGRSLGG